MEKLRPSAHELFRQLGAPGKGMDDAARPEGADALERS